jgi:murein L,D-transpeptidase YcbB/YkuD
MVKSVQFERLLASTAFGLILAMSSHAGLAQQNDQKPAAEVAAPASTATPSTAAKDDSATDDNAAKATEAAKDSAEPAKMDAPKADTAKTDTESKPAADAADTAKIDNKPAADAADTAKVDSKSESKPDAATDSAKTESKPKDTDSTKAAAAPSPVTIDMQAAVALNELITGKRFDRLVSRKDDRAGVEKYYKEHGNKPIWTSNGAVNDRAEAAIAYLRQVDTVGLESSDYPIPDLASSATPEEIAEYELKLTSSVLGYAHDAEVGRIHFTRVDGDISFKLDPPDPASVLAKLADASDAGAALDSYNPPQKEFKALKEKLAELRANGGQIAKPKEDDNPGANVKVPSGKILSEGMKDKRVAALRKRLNIAGDKENPLYDEAVVEAVKAFQTGADLTADGSVGPNTLAALNGEKVKARRPAANPVDTILVNMERWRWLPRKLGNDNNDYVVENTPDFTLSLFHHGKLYWKTKIVVGKPGKETPMLTADMKYITVNPTWNVPPSIIEREYLPALAQDPTVLDRYGLKIYQSRDGTVHIYQPPGAGNALGRIRFNFPNKFLVYQHDTPDKYLFKRTKRAYSHGCLRVQDPLEYGEKLLSLELPEKNYTKAKLESMFGSNEINIDLPNPIPVHLTYQTAFVDEDGKLQLREDVYGRDAKMIRIMKSSERKVAYIPIDRPRDTSAAPVRMPVGTYGSYGDDNNGYSYSYGGGGSFFDFLFGGGQRSAPRPRGRVGGHSARNGNFYRR